MTNEQSLSQWLKNSITTETKNLNQLLSVLNDPHTSINLEKFKTFNELVEQTEFRIKWLNEQLLNFKN
jgi:bacterioferritin (cytochrome b1)